LRSWKIGVLDGAGIFEDWSHNTVIKAEQNHRCLFQVVLVAPPGTLPNLTYLWSRCAERLFRILCVYYHRNTYSTSGNK